MKSLPQLVAALLLCFLIACNANNKQMQMKISDAPSLKNADKAEEQQPLVNNVAGSAQNKVQQQPATIQSRLDWDKEIIRDAHLTIEVKEYKNFNELVHAGIKQFGGYIAAEEQSQSDYRIENVVTIKVPVDQFDNTIEQLTSGTEKMIEKKITAEDVTAEMVDTKSRLEAKKRVRNRYLDLLQRAKNMEEIVQVQKEADAIQENIEAAAGRMDYLGHAAAFSTIHLSFYQVLNPAGNIDPDPSYRYRIVQSFTSGLHWFAELFVLLVSLWPLWMGIAVAVLLIRKRKLLAVKKV